MNFHHTFIIYNGFTLSVSDYSFTSICREKCRKWEVDSNESKRNPTINRLNDIECRQKRGPQRE